MSRSTSHNEITPFRCPRASFLPSGVKAAAVNSCHNCGCTATTLSCLRSARMRQGALLNLYTLPQKASQWPSAEIAKGPLAIGLETLPNGSVGGNVDGNVGGSVEF